jgi:hypothetical protein
VAKKLDNIKANFDENLKDLEDNLSIYLAKTSDVGNAFGGPSIYFHREAIKEISVDFLGKRHIDMIYAMLPSWGMHRMGEKSKTKVIDFDQFIAQIDSIKPELIKLKNKHISEVTVNEILELLVNLHISVSNAFLVSSSKVLHHIIPNLISPIDRQYSIRFMMQKKGNFDNSTINLDYEHAYAEMFLSSMFSFIKKNENIIKKKINSNFNTSITKIFDNLLMVYVKNNKE